MDAKSTSSFQVNGILVDVAGGTLRDEDGSEIALRPQAFALLRHLIDNAGLLVGKDELMRAVWPNVIVTDDSLVQCVRDVRRAIRDDDQSVLKAVRKRGYRLDVRNAAAPAAAPAGAWRRLLLLGVSLGAALAVGLAIASRASLPEQSRLPSVAVLPFASIGGDASTARLAEGLTEDIIIDLARFPEFEVMGSNSSAVYTEAREAGEELGAAFVVQGSIQREAARVSGRIAGTVRPPTCSPSKPRSLKQSRTAWAAAPGLSKKPVAPKPGASDRKISPHTNSICSEPKELSVTQRRISTKRLNCSIAPLNLITAWRAHGWNYFIRI
jgi:DNA-binding winged helix-turn-helix (wHTH) protein